MKEEEYMIIENFLTNRQSNNLVKYYNDNTDKAYKYNLTYPLPLKDTKVKNIIKKIKTIVKNCKLDNLEIVRWPINSYMDEHYDEGDKFAFFIYLNDDYEGGETEIINKIKVIPKKGTVLIFKNSKLLHRVNKIKQKERYTLAGWYV